MSTKPPSASRLRLRITLRLLLLLVSVLCLALGWWTQRARKQRRLVARMSEVYYDYQGRIYYDERDNLLSSPFAERCSWVPPWLLNKLGVDFFHNVIEAHVSDRDSIAELDRFDLRELHIVCENVRDADLQQISKLRKLEVVTICPPGWYTGRDPQLTPVTDRTLDVIGRLPRIEEVHIFGSGFTAKGLAALAKAQTLRKVYLTSCAEDVDSCAIEPFKRSGNVQNLKIVRWIDIKENRSPYRDVVIVGMWGPFFADD